MDKTFLFSLTFNPNEIFDETTHTVKIKDETILKTHNSFDFQIHAVKLIL